jgi:hypothetical protein
MLPIRDPDDVEGVQDAAIRQLLAQRFEEVSDSEPYDPNVMAAFFVVEPGDGLTEIEFASACAIVSGLFGGPRYGETGFVPSFEVLEEHPTCFELVFVSGDGDGGAALFVPKASGVDPELLRFCGEFATPAPSKVLA